MSYYGIKKGLRNKYAETAGIITAGILLFFGFLSATGALFSGYHFVDDHEVVLYRFVMERGQSLWQVMTANIRNDLVWRYRPFYWVERTIGAFFFGADMPLWNFYTACKAVISFCFLYFSARNLKFDSKYGILFSCFIMFGQQITPFYRSANQESTGLLFCSLAGFILTRQIREKKFDHFADNLVFCIAVIMAGFTKESFTLFMPVFLASKLWSEFCEEDAKNQKGKLAICLNRNLWVYLLITAAFLFDLYYILFRVGVDHVSYAGFHQGTTFKQYLRWIYESLFKFTKEYSILGLYVLLAWVVTWKWNPERKKGDIKKYGGFILISLCAMGIQLIAHAESRMWERYLYPYILSYAVLIVLISGDYFRKRKLERLYTAILLLFLAGQILVAFGRARSWTKDGISIGNFFDCLMDETDNESRIICAFRDEELNLAVETKMEAEGWNGLLSYRSDSGIVDLIKITASDWEEPFWALADAVVCYIYDENEMKELMNAGHGECKYDVYAYDNYCIIVREKD